MTNTGTGRRDGAALGQQVKTSSQRLRVASSGGSSTDLTRPQCRHPEVAGKHGERHSGASRHPENKGCMAAAATPPRPGPPDRAPVRAPGELVGDDGLERRSPGAHPQPAVSRSQTDRRPRSAWAPVATPSPAGTPLVTPLGRPGSLTPQTVAGCDVSVLESREVGTWPGGDRESHWGPPAQWPTARTTNTLTHARASGNNPAE